MVAHPTLIPARTADASVAAGSEGHARRTGGHDDTHHRVGVTAAVAHPPPPEAEKTPEAIRAALLPEERDAFDADCRHTLGKTAAESSLEPVRSVIEQWWRIATVTRHNPAAHRRMLRHIDQTQGTGQAPGRLHTWDELQTERGGR
jgi:hypothetical protein